MQIEIYRWVGGVYLDYELPSEICGEPAPTIQIKLFPILFIKYGNNAD